MVAYILLDLPEDALRDVDRQLVLSVLLQQERVHVDLLLVVSVELRNNELVIPRELSLTDVSYARCVRAPVVLQKQIFAHPKQLLDLT